jgi:hypothetical protein
LRESRNSHADGLGITVGSPASWSVVGKQKLAANHANAVAPGEDQVGGDAVSADAFGADRDPVVAPAGQVTNLLREFQV